MNAIIKKIGRVPYIIGGSILAALFFAAGSAHAANDLAETAFNRVSELTITEIMYNPLNNPTNEFIEIYNTVDVDKDISGYQLKGEIDYTFPANTILQGESYIVVAKTPSTISGSKGPFLGSLNDAGGAIKLYSDHGVLLCDVNYNDNYLWPKSADGFGNSLVLARPDFGPSNPLSWAASSSVGGSAKVKDPVSTDSFLNIRINEIVITDTQLKIEFFNTGSSNVSLGGAKLVNRAGQTYTIPSLTVNAKSRKALTVSVSASFEVPLTGGALALQNSAGTRVADAIDYEALSSNASFGRFPDGDTYTTELASATLGAPNTAVKAESIVINEIMYNPISENSDDEYIELYNRSGSSVDLSGWKIDGDVSFKIPAGTTLGAGKYLVIAKDADVLINKYSQLTVDNTIGGFSGKLSNSDGILYFKEPLYTDATSGDISYRMVSRINFKDFWGHLSDGGGSSLELKDPDAHNFIGSSWADSDESNKAPWTTISVSKTLLHGADHDAVDDGDYELHVQMPDNGVCLVDNIQLKINNQNQILNPGFESNFNGWIVGGGSPAVGTHAASYHDTTEGQNSSKCMRVVATGKGESSINHVEYNVGVDFADGQAAVLTAKARWISGCKYLLIRLRGGYLDVKTELDIPDNLGTPGQANSQKVSNAGPSFSDLEQSPALPAANAKVTVTAKITDNDGVKSNGVVLKYRVDPSTTTSSVTMKDDGAGVDAIANDGIYSCEVPGQSAGKIVAYRIEMQDSSSQLTKLPHADLGEALIRWGDSSDSSKSIDDIRVWMTSANKAKLERIAHSDDLSGCTVVYNGARVIHNAGIRFRGSAYIRGTKSSFKIEILEGEKLLGDRNQSLDGKHHSTDSTRLLDEWLVFWFGEEVGVPTPNKRWQFLYLNGSKPNNTQVFADVSRPNPTYLDSRFPKEEEGELHMIDYRIESQDNNNAPPVRSYGLVDVKDSAGNHHDPFYRLVLNQKQGDFIDQSSLYEFIDALYSTAGDADMVLESLADVSMMESLAVRLISCDRDGWGWDNAKNAFVYKPYGGKWHHLLWDLDNQLLRDQNGRVEPWLGNSPGLQRLYNIPSFKRAYWQTIKRAVDGPFSDYTDLINQRRSFLTSNGLNVEAASTPLGWFAARKTKMNSELSSRNTSSFTLTKDVVAGSIYTLEGLAPLKVTAIKINDRTVPLVWKSETTWSIDIVLQATAINNDFVIKAYDANGAQVGSTITKSNIARGAATSSAPTIRLKFDDGSGTTADDLYNKKNGALENGASFSNDKPAVFVNGGGSVKLDGSNDRVALGDSEYQFASGVFSFTMWFKLDAVPTGGWSGGDTFFGKNKYGLSVFAFDSTFGCKVPATTEIGSAMNSSHTSWSHLAFVANGTTYSAYINGAAVISGKPYAAGAIRPGESAYLGYMAGGDLYLDGNISDFQVYDGTAITAAQLEHIMKGEDLSTFTVTGVSLAPAAGNLKITEIMYNPAADPSAPLVDNDEYEFLELYNSSSENLYLGDLSFSEGIDFSFPEGTEIAAGEYAVIVKNQDAFVSRYGSTPRVLGVYSAKLSNSGEQLALIDSGSNVVFDITYDTNSPWPNQADGFGPSLELGNLGWDPALAASWKATSIQGTPGAGYQASSIPAIQISEVLAHTDAPNADTIELYNPTGSTVDVGNWFLSDKQSDKKLYQIPAGTTIPSKGYLRIREDDDGNPLNGYPTSGGYFGNDFNLSSHGDEVVLSSADSNGNLTGYVATMDFGASANPVSFGRVETSDGVVYYTAQETLTLGSGTTSPATGAANGDPKVGPLVISEFLPLPQVGSYEFLEIVNNSTSTVNLYDDTNIAGKSNSDNTYEVKGVGFIFPKNVSMSAGEVIILTDAPSESAFRTAYPTTPAGVQIFTYTGGISGSGERLRIKYPDPEDIDPDTGVASAPYIVMDEVDYLASASWPVASTNQSVAKAILANYSNEPTHWAVLTPTPGVASGGVPPVGSVDVDYIKEGDSWKYFKGTTTPGSTWMNRVFSESGWLTGASGFGYKYTHGTTLSDMQNNYSTVFLRKTFTVASAAAVSELTLTVDCDDGYVAYLNGTEIRRLNAPSGDISFTDIAPTYRHSVISGGSLDVVTVPASLLVDGDNVLAIVALNAGLGSSDLVMTPELTAKVSTGSATDPAATLTKVTNGDFEYAIGNLQSGSTYEIQTTDDLINGPWTTIQTIQGSAGSGSDTVTPTGDKLYIRTKITTP